MNIFKSFSLIVILALAFASVFGMIKGLAVLCFFIGIQEMIEAKECYDKGNRKLAILYFIIGLVVCICGVLSFTNII